MRISIYLVFFNILILIFLCGCTEKKSGETIIFEEASPISPPPRNSYFTNLGIITTKTKDIEKYIVEIEMIISYDLNDIETKTELDFRNNDLCNFISEYFTGKYFSELSYENHLNITKEMTEKINNDILTNGKIKGVLFNRFDIINEEGLYVYK